MKYILILLLLASCDASYHDEQIARLKDEANKYCSCRGRLDSLVINSGNVDIYCKDGSMLKTKDIVENVYIIGCLK
ncbi:hypothetical protein UFOVP53_171 [uncultured Caudovirales phage]|uniref:Uncharacterized protein n=1 Tax=uncultured Caudovirales phage TaxID=2100421 RepID=A0A6J5KZN0_9CAUD|nr:hypothetical protein UFOVP53_171 [uncultured Caudovirales phage]